MAEVNSPKKVRNPAKKGKILFNRHLNLRIDSDISSTRPLQKLLRTIANQILNT